MGAEKTGWPPITVTQTSQSIKATAAGLTIYQSSLEAHSEQSMLDAICQLAAKHGHTLPITWVTNDEAQKTGTITPIGQVTWQALETKKKTKKASQPKKKKEKTRPPLIF